MAKKEMAFVFILGICFLMATNSIFAADFNHVISNSEDWRDVYSSMLYAKFSGADSDFLVSTSHGPLLLKGINKNKKILIISSKDRPFIFNYKDIVDAEGFSGVQERVVKNANLELVGDLDINNFIIVSPSYGYSAIAVAPYAIQSRSWVFLADRTNIVDIEDIMSKKNVGKVLIYGYVDRAVSDALEKYKPEVINTGDKFKDNIEIVKRYFALHPTNQVALTNGEFIEKELMAGSEPVLFTGKENVPDQIRDYIKNSDIEVGVLIGNDLVGAATNIRRSTGISVIVKFARGARNPGRAVAAVEGLDLFYLPSPSLSLKIVSVKYNKANSQLEVTYKSDSNAQAYLKGTITITSDLGEQKVGDVDAVFIAPQAYKTLIYPGVKVSGENITAEIYTLYGEVPTSLDRVLKGTYQVTEISVIDRCEIEVKKLSYSKQNEQFLVLVKNIGGVDCWVEIELKDVLVNGIKKTIGSNTAEKIIAGKSKKIAIEQRMDEQDLKDNPLVLVIAYYGEKQDSLVKTFRGKFKLNITSLTFLTYVIIVLIILIIILFILIIIIRRRDDEEEEYLY